MEEHDVIVLGGGHNGLTVAAYLAKAGVDVLVVEKNDVIGGACVTREITLPGFKHELGAAIMSFLQANPLIINDELGLMSKYGLEWIDLPTPWAFVYTDATAMIFYCDVDKTCQSIAKISPVDAENYLNLINKVTPLLTMLAKTQFVPPVSLTAVMAQLDSSPEGRDFLRWMLMSPFDLANELFEHEKVKLWFARLSLESMMGPTTKGTGLGPILFGPMVHTYPQRLPKGGSSQLPNSLGRCIEGNGGKIRTNALVTKVKVSAGCATSVVLADDEEIKARKAIVSNLDPRPLFWNLVEGTPEEFKKRLRAIQDPDYETIMSHFALNEATHWYCEDINREKPLCINFGSTMYDMLEEFSDVTLGRQRKTLSSLSVNITWVDPSKAPPGKHIFQYGAQELYEMPNWRELKEKKADLYDAYIREHFIDNLTYGNVLARYVVSPVETEEWSPNMYRGQILGPGSSIFQMLSYRPLPEMSNYRTPVEGLYLCGSATHPMGGIFCSGRATVQTVMEDLAISFAKLIT